MYKCGLIIERAIFSRQPLGIEHNIESAIMKIIRLLLFNKISLVRTANVPTLVVVYCSTSL